MCRTPKPVAAIARRLQAEKPTVPVRVVRKANVLDHEIELLPLPFRFPGEMRLLELLAQSRYFDSVRSREENLDAHRVSRDRLILFAALK
jgi:hypothetical protein